MEDESGQGGLREEFRREGRWSGSGTNFSTSAARSIPCAPADSQYPLLRRNRRAGAPRPLPSAEKNRRKRESAESKTRFNRPLHLLRVELNFSLSLSLFFSASPFLRNRLFISSPQFAGSFGPNVIYLVDC